jgi:hypothetical protein
MDRMELEAKIAVHIEVYLKEGSQLSIGTLEDAVLQYLNTAQLKYLVGRLDMASLGRDPGPVTQLIFKNVEEVLISDVDEGWEGAVPFDRAAHYVHICQLSREAPVEETLEFGNEDVAASHSFTLPCREFHNLWSTLIFDSDVKRQLLQYAATAMLFADREVDESLVTFNRVLLLHGPPGTGKTT